MPAESHATESAPVAYSIERHPVKDDPEIAGLFRRFLKNVHTIPETSCWWWSGAAIPTGYGVISVFGDRWLAHRLSYLIHTGQHPAHFAVMHSCDNPACVNPEHLSLGTARENVDDKIAKGRMPVGEAHVRAKLTDEQIREIRSSTERGYILADQYGVSQSHISSIRSGRARKTA